MQALKKWRIPFQKMVQQKLVQLGNNRVLAFEEYGDEKGVPVIFCHGWPSSSTMAQLTEEPARDRGMLALYRSRPRLLQRLFQLAWPILSLRPPVRLRPLILKMLMLQPCDADSLRDSAAFEAVFESQRRAWRGGAEGVMADARIYAQPWRFPLEEVRVPVRLWHGKEDRAFSVGLAEEIATRLPICKARYVDGAGHYSLPIRHVREILAD